MCDSTAKTVLREIAQLNRKSVFDEKAILEPSEGNALELKVTLTPKDGLFAGTAVPFEFVFDGNYPSTAPVVRCLKIVYHSNISDDGSVCFNMFSEPDPSYRVEHYVNGLLWLLDNQNFNSQLNGYVTTERPLFNVNFRLSCLGYEVNGLACSKLFEAEPTQRDKRKLVHEIFTLLGGTVEVQERTATDLRTFLSSRDQSHWEFVSAELPIVKKACDNDAAQGVTFLKTRSNCTHVAVRAKNAAVSPSAVVKEMLVMVGGQLSLILILGPEALDLEKLAAVLGQPVELPKAGELKRKGLANVWELSPFDWTGPVFVDAQLKAHTAGKVVASSGYPRLLVSALPSAMLALLTNQAVTVVEVPRVPLALPTQQEEVAATTTTTTTAAAPTAPSVAAVEETRQQPTQTAQTQQEEVAPRPEEMVAAAVVVVTAEKDKVVAERENSALTEGKKEKEKKAALSVDTPALCRTPSEDGVVKVALESN